MMKKRLTYLVREVVPYINWIYYFHSWGLEPRFATVNEVHDCPSCRAGWIASFPLEEQVKAREAMKLYQEAQELLSQWADEPICHALFLLGNAYSEDDNIIVNNKVRIPLLRQQYIGRDGYTLCLSDFLRGASSIPSQLDTDTQSAQCEEREFVDIANTIGVFATTVSQPSAQLSVLTSDMDLRLNFQFSMLSDRLAEATAEKVHEEIRKHYWGYAPEENLTIHELHEERFQGIRPSVGYPSLPDQSINFLIDELLHLAEIGISISENGAMHPHCSVSGFMFASPHARYFSVGHIGEDQLADYAWRRGMTIGQVSKFLGKQL